MYVIRVCEEDDGEYGKEFNGSNDRKKEERREGDEESVASTVVPEASDSDVKGD